MIDGLDYRSLGKRILQPGSEPASIDLIEATFRLYSTGVIRAVLGGGGPEYRHVAVAQTDMNSTPHFWTWEHAGTPCEMVLVVEPDKAVANLYRRQDIGGLVLRTEQAKALPSFDWLTISAPQSVESTLRATFDPTTLGPVQHQTRFLLALLALRELDRGLHLSVEYALSRRMGGRALIDKQAVRHELAEVFAECRMLSEYAREVFEGEQLPYGADDEVLTRTALRKGPRLTERCTQFFGGKGFLNEYPIAATFGLANLLPALAAQIQPGAFVKANGRER